MQFNRTYFLLTILLFLTEAYIATYVNDGFIRPFFGDLLVVILLYCALKSIINIPATKAALLVMGIAYLIELSQYFHFARVLGVEHSQIAAWLIGSYFSFIDILMYTAGALTIIVTEKAAQKFRQHDTAIQ